MTHLAKLTALFRWISDDGFSRSLQHSVELRI